MKTQLWGLDSPPPIMLRRVGRGMKLGGRVARADFKEKRINGDEKTDAQRPWDGATRPEEKDITWTKGERRSDGYVYGVKEADGYYHYECRYDADTDDLEWMRQTDCNYLKRLLREGNLQTQEPDVWRLREMDGAQNRDIGAWWSEKLKLSNIGDLLTNSEVAYQQVEGEEQARIARRAWEQERVDRYLNALPKQLKSFVPNQAVPADIAIPEFMCCPISGLVMIDPVNNALGHTYEREMIEGWLKDHDTDPNTNAKLPNKTLNENVFARQAIGAFLDSHPQLKGSGAVCFPKSRLVDFRKAIESSNQNQVRTLVQKDRRVLLYYLTESLTPFHVAGESGSPEILAFILSKYTADEISIIKKLPKPMGWNPKVLNTLLFNAINEKDIAKVQQMFALGAELEGRNQDQKTALCLAAEAGKQSIVELLLLRGANISARDSNNNAPLDLALLNDHDEVVLQLLDYGIPDYEPIDKNDRTLLNYKSMFFLHKQTLALSGKTIKPVAIMKKTTTTTEKTLSQPQGQFFKPEKPDSERLKTKTPDWTSTVPPNKP